MTDDQIVHAIKTAYHAIIDPLDRASMSASLWSETHTIVTMTGALGLFFLCAGVLIATN